MGFVSFGHDKVIPSFNDTLLNTYLLNVFSMQLNNIANLIGAKTDGVTTGIEVVGICSLDNPKQDHIGFATQPRALQDYLVKHVPSNLAAIILPQPQLESFRAVDSVTPCLLHSTPYYAYALLSQQFAQQPIQKGIHPSAIVATTAKLADDVTIGPYAVIGEHVVIGQGTCIEAGCAIGDNVNIGNYGHFYPQVTIYHGVSIGDYAGCIVAR
jgi:UDP-3-O-[3-hydroxymyristoyl] glucosamine N-acyltransferase